MKFLPFITSSIYQIVSLIFFVAFLLGILNIHFSDRTNYCEMTYMYEYPQFVVRLSVVVIIMNDFIVFNITNTQ